MQNYKYREKAPKIDRNSSYKAELSGLYELF